MRRVAETPFQSRFLLLSGESPSSLGSWAAAFLGTMLAVPGDEKQHRYLAAGELLGVLSGLLLPLPLEFLSTTSSGQDEPAELAPLDQIFNAVAFVSFVCILISLLGSLLAALMAVFQGWKATAAFYERSSVHICSRLCIYHSHTSAVALNTLADLNNMLGTAFFVFILGFWTLVAVVARSAIVACDGTILGWVPTAVFLALFQWCMNGWAKLYANELSLELFHLPAIFRLQFIVHHPSGFAEMQGSRLRDAAEKRALFLSTLMPQLDPE